jgi:hypothetical protein
MFKHRSFDEGGSRQPAAPAAGRTQSVAVRRGRTSGSALARAFSGLSVSRRRSETAEELKGPLGLGEPLAAPDAEPLADLIFVHGLGGGSRKTWSFGSDASLFWPREWLPRDPEFANVRIHSFGYDADYANRRSSNLQIYDFAKKLLSAMQYSPLIRRSQRVSLPPRFSLSVPRVSRTG